MQLLIKEKVDRIALNKGPAISLATKGGPKKQCPTIMQFLIKGTPI